MCYLLVHHATRPAYPLVLLANRDEAYDRPFEPPRLAGDVLAPRDLRAGGTWLGCNRAGLVAAVTNRRGPEPPQALRSRGRLVADALAYDDVATARRWTERHLEETPYAAFNLLLADGRDAVVVRHDGSEDGRPRPAVVLALEPGAHTITNRHELDEAPVPPAGLPDPGEPLAAALFRLELLARDERTPLPGGHRILERGVGGGTVCSAILALPDAPGHRRVFRFAGGVPGEAPFDEHAWPQ